MNSAELAGYLKRHFGFSHFRQGQDSIIMAALAGRDVLGVIPTGAGKSLTYQLPALLQDGLTIVISPLIALMTEQVNSLKGRGVPAEAMNGTLSNTVRHTILGRLEQLKLLYVAPERLQHEQFLQSVRHVHIDRIVIDEAHCISEWGHDFRPEYRRIDTFRQCLGPVPITALTATATPQVQTDIRANLNMRDPVTVITGFDRPNLAYHAWPVLDEALKPLYLKHFLSQQTGSGIVYVGTRQEAQSLSHTLTTWGHRSDYYHGERTAEDRARVQEAFMTNKLQVITATNAFGMGIDKPNIRYVLHYRPPGTLESYYQEAGRAGRDGRDATCLVLHSPRDHDLHSWFIASSIPTALDIKRLYLLLRNSPTQERLTTLQELATDLQLPTGKTKSTLLEMTRQNILSYTHQAAGMLLLTLLEPYRRQVPVISEEHLTARRTARQVLLEHVRTFTQTNHCRRQTLLRYFGDPTPPTGPCMCDNCAPGHLCPTPPEALRILNYCQPKARTLQELDTHLAAHDAHQAPTGALCEQLRHQGHLTRKRDTYRTTRLPLHPKGTREEHCAETTPRSGQASEGLPSLTPHRSRHCRGSSIPESNTNGIVGTEHVNTSGREQPALPASGDL
jgi:ATP-dependent DNA helicase RecQ